MKNVKAIYLTQERPKNAKSLLKKVKTKTINESRSSKIYV